MLYAAVYLQLQPVKTLTKSEELYPQGWTVGDQIKFKKGTTASLNDNGAVISGVLASDTYLRPQGWQAVLLTIYILFLHILTAARFSRVITDIGTITVPTI